MITQTNTRKIESTMEPLKEVNYHFDPKNLRHIAKILREMYADPVLAVVREYAANATDAHVSAGIAHRPIEITVPTMSQPEIVYRDFGFGLDLLDTEKLLFGYGASADEKRTSNELIGGFGIGAKSGYAVSDQFSFISIHAGTKHTWLCYIDQDEDCRANLVSSRPTTEPSGIEVRIPVPADLVCTFQERISTCFRYYTVKPVLHNGSQSLIDHVNRPPSEVLFSGSLLISSKHQTDIPVRWEIISGADLNFKELEAASSYGYYYRRGVRQETNSAVVMGQVWCPIDMAKAVKEENLHIKGLILHAPIGALQLAPSRESLSYSSRVKDTLKGIFTQVLHEVGKELLTRVGNVKTSRELFSVLQTVENSLPPELQRVLDGKEVRAALSKRGLCRTGYEVTAAQGFERVIHATSRQRYTGAGGYRHVYGVTELFTPDSGTTRYTFHRESPLVCLTYSKGEKLPRHPKEILHRLGSFLYPNMQDKATGTSPIKDASSFSIVVHEEGLSLDVPWLADGSVIQVKYSDLPGIPDSVWLECTAVRSCSSLRSSGGSNRSFYAQHGKKFNLLSKPAVSYGMEKSGSWTAVPANTLNDAEQIVFVYHDRFVPKGGTDAYQTWKALMSLGGSFDDLKAGLFGLRVGEREWVAKNKESRNLVELSEYLPRVLPQIEKDTGITPDQIEAGVLLSQLSSSGVTRGAVPFILGASKDAVLEPELHYLLNCFRSPGGDGVFKAAVHSLTWHARGRKFQETLGYQQVIEGEKIKKVPVTASRAVRAFSTFLLRIFQASRQESLFRSLVDSLDRYASYVDQSGVHGKSMDKLFEGPSNINTEKYYKLMLQMEAIKL